MEITGKLFHSLNGEARVKILRLFYSNLDNSFTVKTLAENLKLKPEIVKKEIQSLFLLNLLQRDLKNKNHKNLLYKINPDFSYFVSLKNLLFDFQNMNKKNIFERFKKIGRFYLFIFAGVFVQESQGPVDILIVFDLIKTNKLEKVLAEIKIDLGMDLKYLIMNLDEYNYRQKMFDKTLRMTMDGNRFDWINKL